MNINPTNNKLMTLLKLIKIEPDNNLIKMDNPVETLRATSLQQTPDNANNK